jgi:arylsulfatase A-like enzyme
MPAPRPRAVQGASRTPRAARWALALLALVGSGCNGSTAEPAGDEPGARRNLILIVVDTLRADHIGAVGGPVPTPTMDALAASGVLFSQARSHIPTTGPSHGSMFTSLLPSEHGTRGNSQTLDDANLTLAEALGAQGWHTAAFVSLGVLQDRFGFDQGFDEYSNWFQGRWWKSGEVINSEVLRWIERASDDPLFLFLHYSDPHTPYAPPDYDYPLVTLSYAQAELARMKADARAERVSLTLQPGANDIELMPPEGVERDTLGCGLVTPSVPGVEVHFSKGEDFLPGLGDGSIPPFGTLPTVIRLVNPTPDPLPITLDVTTRINLPPDAWPEWYGREVAFLDAKLGRVVDALKRQGLWEDSVVVLTADHGEGLGQHDLQQHIEQLYDTLLRVPLIVAAPGLLPEGEVVDLPVQHVDLLPTVLDLLGVPSDRPMRGRSLVPIARGDAPATPVPILGETHRPEARRDQRSLVFNGFKYIVDTGTGAEELYALADDPGELHDLAAERPDVLERLRATMAEQFALRLGPDVEPAGRQALTEEERARMAELGYTR